MLVNEWAQGIDVAFGTNGVLSCSGSKEVGLERTVRVMTVGALQQSFVDPVVEWLHESSLNVGVALIAESGLLRLKHLRLGFKLMGAVAADAADLSFAVSSPREVGVLTNVAR